MRFLLSVIIICLLDNLYAQVSLQPIPCLTVYNTNHFNNNVVNDTVFDLNCINIQNTNIFGDNNNLTVYAGQKIIFNPNTKILTTNSNKFKAYIEEGPEIAWVQPQTYGKVGIYDKLELGLKMPNSINEQITKYINSGSSGLNPFNPENIDVYAVFVYDSIYSLYISNYVPVYTYPVYSNKRVNGFYYEEYQRNPTDWTKLANDYSFRIRFTPRILGTWQCQIITIVNQTDTFKLAPFTFECVPSNKKDFMTIGENKRYFKIGNEPFFPVGQNILSPSNPPNYTTAWSKTPTDPVGYLDFHERIRAIKSNGGNYFRYIVAPWNTEIEFEHLNNYSKRMSNAWEFDKILELSDSLDLRIHFDMQIHYPFEAPGGYAMQYWDWSKPGDPNYPIGDPCTISDDNGYCYNTELNMPAPISFLTNVDAKKYYKYRIRYMIARWGYSTNIAVLELLSEIQAVGSLNQLYQVTNSNGAVGCKGTPVHSYYNDGNCTSCNALVAWQTEMLEYIKETLGHTDHLTAVSSAGPPIDGYQPFEIPFVDIPTYNHYQQIMSIGEHMYSSVEGTYHNVSSGKYVDKPMMFSEVGYSGSTIVCDNDIGYIKYLYFSPFIGLSGAAMNWEDFKHQTDQWKYMRHINDFMSGLKLDEENWSAQEPLVFKDRVIELYHLKSKELDDGTYKVVGVLANRGFNYYNMGDPNTICADINNVFEDLDNPNNSDRDAEYITNPQNVAYSDLNNANKVKISGMGNFKHYEIKWYNALTGNYITTITKYSNGSGFLKLKYPNDLTYNFTQPILFFEVYKKNTILKGGLKSNDLEVKTIKQHNEKEINTNNSPDVFNIIKVAPNPTTDVISILLSYGNSEFLNYALTNLQGKVLETGLITENYLQLDLSDFEKGVYFITFVSNSKKETIKIIKQ